MKNAVFSLLAVAAAANASVSTYYETKVYTITSCEPGYATKCSYETTSSVKTLTSECDEATTKAYPTTTASASGYGHVTTTQAYATSVASSYAQHETSTSCSESAKYETTQAPVYTVSTVYETKKYTITSCAPDVYDCPVGHVSTTVIASTTLCPVETAYPSKPVDVYYPSKPVEVVYPSKSVEVHYPAQPVETTYPTTPVVGCPGGAYCPATTIKTAYGTGAPTGYHYPSNNGTVEYTGTASAQRAGGLLVAVGLAAAALL